MLDKPGDLAGLLTGLEEGDVLFIDEIHRLSPIVEEYLYSAMEDYCIDIMIDKGPAARSVQLTLQPFTLIGATTRSGLLTGPLRARFGINSLLEYYDADVLTGIVRRSAGILKVEILERSPYTTLVSLSCRLPTDNQFVSDPHMKIRVCHDAKVAEVVSYQDCARFQAIYPFPNRFIQQVREKRQVNRFLGEWLDVCLQRGLSFSLDTNCIRSGFPNIPIFLLLYLSWYNSVTPSF